MPDQFRLTPQMLAQARVIAKGYRAKTGELMIVKLRAKNGQHPDLSADQQYVVIGIEADDFRILNDQGRPYLYPHDLFDLIDQREPDDWVHELGDDGARYAYPSSLNHSGFFEDFFDARQAAVATFWHVVNQRLAMATA